MLRRAAELVIAGEWPWEPEKMRERKALENAVEKLCDVSRSASGSTHG